MRAWTSLQFHLAAFSITPGISVRVFMPPSLDDLTRNCRETPWSPSLFSRRFCRQRAALGDMLACIGPWPSTGSTALPRWIAPPPHTHHHHHHHLLRCVLRLKAPLDPQSLPYQTDGAQVGGR
mmetsp:Transcript_14801/g.43869  ORF Transcript_14801/g.43869 Transcript_14801/m.43869 type:complete len:123 (+) Transcript_14801:322-690(+)